MIDRLGRTVKVNDKVRLPNGDVVLVLGQLDIRREVKMNQCEIVDKKTKLKRTNRPVVGEVMYG